MKELVKNPKVNIEGKSYTVELYPNTNKRKETHYHTNLMEKLMEKKISS